MSECGSFGYLTYFNVHLPSQYVLLLVTLSLGHFFISSHSTLLVLAKSKLPCSTDAIIFSTIIQEDIKQPPYYAAMFASFCVTSLSSLNRQPNRSTRIPKQLSCKISSYIRHKDFRLFVCPSVHNACGTPPGF